MEKQILLNFEEKFEDIINGVKRQIVGQDEVIREVLIAIIAGENVLLEGTPGLGKTMLIKTFSKVLDLPFSRIQFTPDLMPVDITGTEIINKHQEGIKFVFEEGPIFSSMVLADEINRATPKTQSALLEAMQERTVTVGKKTYILPEPFFVLATQNPLEMEGTYNLPEAQLDRFMFKINIGLPKTDELVRIIDVTVGDMSNIHINKRADKEDIMKMKEMAMNVPIAAIVKEKAVEIMLNTHPEHTDISLVKEYVRCGSSPRGIQAMVKAAKVRALAQGRFNVALEDLEQVALPCLRHRVFLNFKAMADKIDGDYVIKEVLKKVK